MFVQIWPVAHGSITGIKNGDALRFCTPQITIDLQDLYPDSRTCAQIYEGPPTLGTEGTLAGSGIQRLNPDSHHFLPTHLRDYVYITRASDLLR